MLLKYHNKIYTRILVNKIQSALENILAPEQTTAINGRTITENLKLNQDVMSYANANKIQTAMIALEQEKSFDRMENKDSWSKLKNTVQGERALVTSVSNEESAVWKAVIYDSAHYICGNIFRECKTKNSIKCIVIDKKEAKTSVFADDTTIYIGNTIYNI